MAYGHYLSAYDGAHHRLHNTLEYPGYDNELVLGRRGNMSYYGDDDYYYGSSYPSYRSYNLYATPSRYQTRYYDPSDYNHVEWMDAPMTLGVSLCCQDCKVKLSKALRKIHGVHDVEIRGWTPARVTVTGTANPQKILKKARKLSSTAHWMDSQSRDNYYNYDNRHRHWWHR